MIKAVGGSVFDGQNYLPDIISDLARYRGEPSGFDVSLGCQLLEAV